MDFKQLLRRTLINYVSASEGKLRKGIYQPPLYVTSSILEISYLIHSVTLGSTDHLTWKVME